MGNRPFILRRLRQSVSDASTKESRHLYRLWKGYSMNNTTSMHQFEDNRDPQPLATWLLRLLVENKPPIDTIHDESDQLLIDYHPHFFQQLPDFIMALLHNDPNAILHYAPLLYHLAGCKTCHQAYKELYVALHAALEPEGEYTPLSATSTLDTT